MDKLEAAIAEFAGLDAMKLGADITVRVSCGACRVAVKAIREQMLHRNGCKHCAGKCVPFGSSGLESTMRLEHQPDGSWCLRIGAELIPIRACPKCGRLLYRQV